MRTFRRPARDRQNEWAGRNGRDGQVDDDAGLARLQHRALRRLAASRFYRYSLIGRGPADLKIGVGQRWPGDPRRGARIAEGEIELAGELVRHPSPRWLPPSAGAQWLVAWHGFGWIADLAAAGEPAMAAGSELIRSWIAENGAGHGLAWRSDVLATRVCAWLAYIDDFARHDPDHSLRPLMLTSLAAQLRHLARTAPWERIGDQRLRALKGLIAGLVASGGPPARLARALRALEREIAGQILPDGGHRSRSPSLQLQILQDLVDTRAVLRLAGIATPAGLQQAIERMAPILRLFRHGDRRLALFNDSLEEDGVLIDLVLTRSEARGPAPERAPDTGFDRLDARESLVLVDTGNPPMPGFDQHAHAGPLSFEMSHGRERIIVNCGAYRGADPGWARVARASAAHSLLVVADTNSVEIRNDGLVGRSPAVIASERAEHQGQQWISATHDGYRTRFGLVYTRQIFLAANGEDIRGEEQLTGRPGSAFAVRFHLHPAVQPALVKPGQDVRDSADVQDRSNAGDEASALLRLPSGMVWRLRAVGADISLGESVYLGSGEVRKTQQVVLSGAVAPGGTAVRWALRREPRGTAAD